MFVIGITGGIGCGKSTLADLMREAGIPVLDADQISRETTAPGGTALPEIAEFFGPRILNEQGELDREELARQVFKDRKKLDQLERIVHRYVLEQMGRRMAEWKEQACKVCALDVPIPVRNGFLDRCDQVWCVWASVETRLLRLEKRGMERAEAIRRMEIQMDEKGYRDISDHMIMNDGSLSDLRAQTAALFKEELESRGIPYRSIL